MNLSLVANTIRGLAMDGVQAAKSGHPGMPMGMADVATVLWLKFLKHNPKNPSWINRDRFILSAGHGSMLHYSLLHLAGFEDMTLDQLKNFRQWNSITAGHPEYGHALGVETTTGPLGQGCANAVGMAIAEEILSSRYNTSEQIIIDHYTYVIASEGEFEEGASHEVFSMAGNHGLGKLIIFYDQNFISIEGDTHMTYTDDVKKRMEAYDWHVQEINGHDYDQISEAIYSAQNNKTKPSIIICNTTIGYGSPNKAGSHDCHGAPLGEEEVALSKKNLGLPNEQFYISEEVKNIFTNRNNEMKEKELEWCNSFNNWKLSNKDLFKLWESAFNLVLPNFEDILPEFESGSSMATRASSGQTIQILADNIPYLVGGSADLAPSNNTYMKSYDDIGKKSFSGRNFRFGVRELGMAGIMTGIQLHGGLRVYGGTFLVFADFLRPAARLAALMGVPVIYVFTHDSFCVGEDGPTHQPIETCASLRMIHNMTVIRPCDANEVKVAWETALKNLNGPTALLLTRQNLPTLDRTKYTPAKELEKGAYILWSSSQKEIDIILIGTGSEVQLVLDVGEKLASEGYTVSVISMPSCELFENQSKEYKESVLPDSCDKRIVVEAGTSFGWEKYVGRKGKMICKNDFGASAPYGVLLEEFGFTIKNVYKKAKELLEL